MLNLSLILASGVLYAFVSQKTYDEETDKNFVLVKRNTYMAVDAPDYCQNSVRRDYALSVNKINPACEPYLFDVDDDGDLDVLLSDGQSRVDYYENIK